MWQLRSQCCVVGSEDGGPRETGDAGGLQKPRKDQGTDRPMEPPEGTQASPGTHPSETTTDLGPLEWQGDSKVTDVCCSRQLDLVGNCSRAVGTLTVTHSATGGLRLLPLGAVFLSFPSLNSQLFLICYSGFLSPSPVFFPGRRWWLPGHSPWHAALCSLNHVPVFQPPLFPGLPVGPSVPR